jgi:hypothetical protein
MSMRGADVVIIRYAARSRRMRRRKAAGGSPATDLIIRSKWNREKCSRNASSSPVASWSSSTSARVSTKPTKVSRATVIVAAMPSWWSAVSPLV